MKKVSRDRIRSSRWWAIPVGAFVSAIATVAWLTGHKSSPEQDIGPYITLTGTLVAATVATTSIWISLQAPARAKRLEILLTYVERQLSELWGPLYGKISLSQYHYSQLLERLGFPPLHEEGSGDDEAREERGGRPVNGVTIRRAKESLDPFLFVEARHRGGRRWTVWRSYAEDYAISWNTSVAELITQHYSLMGQDHLPDIQRFLAHSEEYLALHEQVCKEIDEQGSTSKKYRLQNLFPEAFEYHIYHRVRFLLYLQKKYRLRLDGAQWKRLKEIARKGGRHREMSRSRPAQDLEAEPETWARKITEMSTARRVLRRDHEITEDAAWLLAQAAVPVASDQAIDETGRGRSEGRPEQVYLASRDMVAQLLTECRNESDHDGVNIPEWAEVQRGIRQIERLGGVHQSTWQQLDLETGAKTLSPAWILGSVGPGPKDRRRHGLTRLLPTHRRQDLLPVPPRPAPGSTGTMTPIPVEHPGP